MKKTTRLILFVVINAMSLNLYAQYDVKNFGAKGDGSKLDTRFIQRAIDKATEMGGGIVTVFPGTYLIGTLILKDNVELHIQAGATLLGSPDYKDYADVKQKFESRSNELYTRYFMIFAEGAKNISITGAGTINGNGVENFNVVYPQNQRPFTIRLVDCENVIIRDIHLLDAANWTLHLMGCRDVNIEGVTIKNGTNANRDGLDIDCCQRVTVSDSRFSTGDDAIVLKSSSDILCQDIAITNCIISSRASAIKTGTESNGGFKNITVSNCIIKDIPEHAGIELMTVDGGIMQNILLENITMENVATPVFIRVGIRARPYKTGQYVTEIEDVRDISLNNISVFNAKLPSSIMGLHNRKIQNVSITNYMVRYSETQDAIPFNKVPFEEFSYPMAIAFKNLPAYGLYCRNVEQLHLQNITMYSSGNETRPALTFDRVNILDLSWVKAEVKNNTTPLAYFRNSKNITAGYCLSIGNSNSLFETEGNTVENLNVSNSVLKSGQKELVSVPALEDENFFEDFKTELKYTVGKGKIVNGLAAQSISDDPVKFTIDINKRGSLQLCLLMLNESVKPRKVIVRYEGITQEFLIDWNEWGWAPITLLKEFAMDRKIEFEISTFDENSVLQFARASFRYQDIVKTD